jgi:hypothetical protein
MFKKSYLQRDVAIRNTTATGDETDVCSASSEWYGCS